MTPIELLSLKILKISKELQDTPWIDLSTFGPVDTNPIRAVIDKHAAELSTEVKARIENEFFGAGPIQSLLEQSDVSEILINAPDAIWFEQHGRLKRHCDGFHSDLTFKNFVHFLSKEINTPISLERPFGCGTWNNWRVHIAGQPCTPALPTISIRKPALAPWTLKRFNEGGWCTLLQIRLLEKIMFQKENFIVVGPTGSGKTSVLSALLGLIPAEERAVILEDTPELSLPNSSSVKLITRIDSQGLMPDITLSDLVKQSLRMRPDRLILGEVRGAEAKDLLMALSTGHAGSMGTLHARSGQEALLRLEMLVQLGAPEWSLLAIRRLIFLSLKFVIVVTKESCGARKLGGIYRITSLEDFGFLLEKVDEDLV